MIFFVSPLRAARGFKYWLTYLLDPNKPLFSKILMFSVPLIIAFLIYKFRNRKNSN
jgi:hypothetical protein